MHGVRILKPCTFLGKRSQGEVIGTEELEAVSAAVIAANETIGNLEILKGPEGSPSGQSDARIDVLTENVAALKATVSSLYREVETLKSARVVARGRGRKANQKGTD